jgi:hypothetical protein
MVGDETLCPQSAAAVVAQCCLPALPQQPHFAPFAASSHSIDSAPPIVHYERPDCSPARHCCRRRLLPLLPQPTRPDAGHPMLGHRCSR